MGQEQVVEKVKLTGMLEQFREALEVEIETIEKDPNTNITISNGKQMPKIGEEYRYVYTMDFLSNSIVPDTPCQLNVGKDYYDATIIGIDGTYITIVTKEPLNNAALGKAVLKTSSAALLQKLIKRIEEKADHKSVLVDKMFNAGNARNDGKKISSTRFKGGKEYNDEQKAAIKSSLENDVTFIWGPPGTGKTTVISTIIVELYKKGESVLLASHTNTAVDNALEKADQNIEELIISKYGKLPEKEPWPILRVGTSQGEINERLTEDAHIKALNSELDSKEKKCNERIDTINNDICDLEIRAQKINWVEATNIEVIKGKRDALIDEEKGINVIKGRKERVEARLAPFDETEIKRYESDCEEQEELNDEIGRLKEQIDDLNAEADGLETRIKNLEDLRKKGKKYEELIKRLDSMVSIQTERNDIRLRENELKQEIKLIEEARSSISSNEQIVSEYESKGSFGKFFANKNQIEKARAEIKNSKDYIEKALLRKDALTKLLESKRKELADHVFLIEQCKDSNPGMSLEEIESRYNNLSALLSKKRDAHARHLRDYEKKTSRLNKITSRIEGTAFDIDLYETLSQKAEEVGEELSAAKEQYNRNSKELDGLIDDEFERCRLFASETDWEGDVNSAIAFLEKLKRKISKEVKGISLEEIEEHILSFRDEVRDLYNELEVIRKQKEEAKKVILEKAEVMGATLTKTYLSDDIQARQFDALIIDEASMAAMPSLWCAACLSSKRLIIVGDFMQLPPVVRTSVKYDDYEKKNINALKRINAYEWLGKDIFVKNGLVDRQKKKNAPSNFVILNKQYRMEKEIADISNCFYGEYNTTLEVGSDENIKQSRNRFNKWFMDDIYPWVNDKHYVRIIDTKSLDPWATGVPGSSRCNYFNAAVDVELAFSLLESYREKGGTLDSGKPLIIIVAPYRPQIKLLDKLLASEFKARNYPEEGQKPIIAGTVHSFQGKESPVVIFDLVIDEPHGRNNLCHIANEDSNKKLLNVAVSRAQNALFVVCNKHFCTAKGKGRVLGDVFLRHLEKHKTPVYEAKELFPKMKFAKNTVMKIDEEYLKNCLITNGETFYRYLYKDMEQFKERMIIYAPFLSHNRISELLPHIDDALSDGNKTIKVFTKDKTEWRKKDIPIMNKCIAILRKHNVEVIFRRKMHEKLIFFDHNIVWLGSLNTLSYNGTTGEFMMRSQSKELFETFEKSQDFKNVLIEKTENNPEGKAICPICREVMTACEGDKGEMYWKCMNDDFTWNPEAPLPLDGVMKCKKCGTPYVFKMKNEARWVCPKCNGYMKTRWVHLKLKKMHDLIPKDQIDEVIEKMGRDNEQYKKEILAYHKKSNHMNDDQIRLDLDQYN